MFRELLSDAAAQNAVGTLGHNFTYRVSDCLG